MSLLRPREREFMGYNPLEHMYYLSGTYYAHFIPLKKLQKKGGPIYIRLVQLILNKYRLIKIALKSNFLANIS